MIRRVEFDALLVSLACEAGAELDRGRRHRGGVAGLRTASAWWRATAGTFEAPVVIAADGVHSVVARRLGSTGLAATRRSRST